VKDSSQYFGGISFMKAKRRNVLTLITAALLSIALVVSGCSSGSKMSDHATSPSANGYYSDSGDGYYYNGEQYLDIIPTGERSATKDPEITLSLKVDTAAYTNAKRYLENGQIPPFDSVRTEELINYFDYDTPLELSDDSPFAIYTELGPSPFDADKQLAFIRVKTEDLNKEELPESNLVFLIDTSGSMFSYDKLPLLQNAFAQLVDTLGKDDRVSIVTYAGSSNVVLEGVRGSQKDLIKDALYSLEAGGSTAGAQGIQTAYALASDFYIKGGNNRVILATDGDFNVGISDTGKLEDFISKKRESNLYLSVLGFGTGNIRDDIMETLATHGNGNYSYIDSQETAKKVLVSELGSNLFAVANDVKAQLAFDPDVVQSYRLIGYENRTMANKDFEDDSKDAGEIGVGSDVIVLLELEVTDSENSPFEVKIRYKNPDENDSRLISVPADSLQSFTKNTTDFGFASSVALYGELLRYPEDATRAQVTQAIDLVENNLGKDTEGYRSDYLKLLKQLSELL
jgi:Ca-activated chloride channel family protein